MQSLSMSNFRRNFLATTGAASLIATQSAVPAAFAATVDVTTCPDFDGLVAHIGNAGPSGTVSFDIDEACTITITDAINLDGTSLRIENVSEADLTFVRYADFTTTTRGSLSGITSFGYINVIAGELIFDNVIFDGKFEIDLENLTYSSSPAEYPYLAKVAAFNGGPRSAFIYGGPNTSLEFQGSTFTNNVWASGFIYSSYQDSLVINNSTFQENGGTQAAVFSAGVDALTITNSTFDKNVSIEGGALHVYSSDDATLTISDSTFSNNKSTIGGAIFVFSTYEFTNGKVDVYIDNVTFKDNYAEGFGGAIDLLAYDVEIKDSTFDGNSSTGNGGAVRVDTYGPLLIDNTDFFDNSANPDGGAIDINVWDTAATITDSTFERNRANGDDGGAIHAYVVNDGYLLIEDSSFTENYTINSGGAVDIDNNGSPGGVQIKNSSFKLNTAETGDGGAIDGSSVVGINIDGSTFDENGSGSKGGAIWFNENAYVYNSLFYKNDSEYGGAIFVDDDRTRVFSSTFVENTAVYGGAIYVEDNEKLALYFSTLINNSATDHGNSIYFEDDSDNYLAGNIFVVQSGGHFYAESGTDSLSDYGSNIFVGDVFESVSSIPENFGQSLVGIPNIVDAEPGDSAIATLEQLDLQALALNTSNPSNTGTTKTVALGPDSVAIDFIPMSVAFDAFGEGNLEDQRGVVRATFAEGGSASANYGNAIDAGAFESIYTFNSEPVPVEARIEVVDITKQIVSPAGDDTTLEGRNLDKVTEVIINGESIPFTEEDEKLTLQTPELDPGQYDLTLVSSVGRLTLVKALSVIGGLSSGEFHSWVKRVSDDEVKIYAVNANGRKLRFIVDGEVIFVKTPEDNDKIVRSVTIKLDGKTRLEIQVDGERYKRATYTYDSPTWNG